MLVFSPDTSNNPMARALQSIPVAIYYHLLRSSSAERGSAPRTLGENFGFTVHVPMGNKQIKGTEGGTIRLQRFLLCSEGVSRN